MNFDKFFVNKEISIVRSTLLIINFLILTYAHVMRFWIIFDWFSQFTRVKKVLSFMIVNQEYVLCFDIDMYLNTLLIFFMICCADCSEIVDTVLIPLQICQSHRLFK